MKRKILSVLLACVMVSSLTACGGEEAGKDDATKEEITEEKDEAGDAEAASEEGDVSLIAAWWGSQNRNDKFTAAFDAYTESNPNVTFEHQINTFGDHMTAVSAAAASDTMPDLVMLQTDYLKTYTDADKLLDLTPYIESGALDTSNISENVIATGMVGDGIYGISAGNNAGAMIYNKTLLDENGITIENFMDIDTFMDVCREVYEKTGVKTQIGNYGVWLEFMSRESGAPFFDGKALGAASADVYVPFFKMIENGYKEGWLLDQGIVTANGEELEAQAIVKYTSPETQSWCSFFNSNQMVALQSSAPEGMELDLVTMPIGDHKKAAYVRQAMCWSISANSANVDEAVAVLNWWINSEEANEIVMGEPGVPANSEIATYVSGMLDETTAKTFDYVNDIVIPNCSAGDPPAEAGAPRVRGELMTGVVEKVAYGEATAEEAAQELFEKGNAYMAEDAS